MPLAESPRRFHHRPNVLEIFGRKAAVDQLLSRETVPPDGNARRRRLIHRAFGTLCRGPSATQHLGQVDIGNAGVNSQPYTCHWQPATLVRRMWSENKANFAANHLLPNVPLGGNSTGDHPRRMLELQECLLPLSHRGRQPLRYHEIRYDGYPDQPQPPHGRRPAACRSPPQCQSAHTSIHDDARSGAPPTFLGASPIFHLFGSLPSFILTLFGESRKCGHQPDKLSQEFRRQVTLPKMGTTPRDFVTRFDNVWLLEAREELSP